VSTVLKCPFIEHAPMKGGGFSAVDPGSKSGLWPRGHWGPESTSRALFTASTSGGHMD
jgi:hypothetical protein